MRSPTRSWPCTCAVSLDGQELILLVAYTERAHRIRIISFQPARRPGMSNAPTSTTGRDGFDLSPEDRLRLQRMTEAEVVAAARAAPDAQPIPPERLARMGRPLAKVVRHQLRMTREDFAAAYGIPLATLVRWERLEAEPTATELSYLKLIARNPEAAKAA